MVGVRQFDKQKALHDAMMVFWDLGYEATSVDDLAKATGLSRSSLYGTFGNKQELYLNVIDHYLSSSQQSFHDALAHEDVETALAGALAVLKNRLIDHRSRAGCLLVLAAENSDIRAPAIKRRVVEAFANEERAYYDRIRKGQIEGQLRPESDARALSRFFAAQGRAMGINARVTNDPTVHDDVIKTAIEAIAMHLTERV